MIRVSVVLAALLLAGGCTPKGGGPTNTLDRYSAALRSGDYGTAYKMMSERFRAKHTQKEFIRMMKENDREVRETAKRLRDKRKKYEVSAEFRYGLGDSMRLVREKGRWSISTVPVRFYSQATPREALRSFIRAYRLERWDVMLRFVPSKYRERMDISKLREQFDGVHREEMASMMNMLEANIDEPIKDKGNEARMPYGDRYEVVFVREDGLWMIKDLD
jgi:hypothetical protein